LNGLDCPHPTHRSLLADGSAFDRKAYILERGACPKCEDLADTARPVATILRLPASPGLVRTGKNGDMAKQEPDSEPWVHPVIEIRESAAQGRGLFASGPIQAGQRVVRFGGHLVTHEQLVRLLTEAGQSGRYIDTLQVGINTHLVLPEGTTAHYGNHCCDPNVWLDGPFDLVSRRDIAPDEEVTVDYATFSILPGFVMACKCATSSCRSRITGNDWQLESLQNRYGNHWTPAALELIKSHREQQTPSPNRTPSSAEYSALPLESSTQSQAVEIRKRQPQDIEELAELARMVHALDGYPPYMPNDDFAGFLQSKDAIAAWTASVDRQPVGQIALHSRSSVEVMRLACDELGISPDGIAVIARLLVDPDHRRTGLAQQLLSVAQAEATVRGRIPILDVAERFAPAIALYEREGWTRLGTVSVHLPDGTAMSEHVYAVSRDSA